MGISIIAADSPDSFVDEGPTAVMVRLARLRLL
jgi:hypothetical protein